LFPSGSTIVTSPSLLHPERAIVDGWDTDKAMEEATALGLTNETLKQFFLAQIQQRKR